MQPRGLRGDGWWCGLKPRVYGNLLYVMRRSDTRQSGGEGGGRETAGRRKQESVEDETGPGLGSAPGLLCTLGYRRESVAGTGMANSLDEGESEFAALNMVDSRIGCAVAGRYGPHHRPAGRTIPVRCIPTIQRRVHPLSLREEEERKRLGAPSPPPWLLKRICAGCAFGDQSECIIWEI